MIIALVAAYFVALALVGVGTFVVPEGHDDPLLWSLGLIVIGLPWNLGIDWLPAEVRLWAIMVLPLANVFLAKVMCRPRRRAT